MDVNVNSGDGNSIFEIAAKFQQMQLREIRKNIETIKQKLRSGEDTGSTKFLDDMDKLNGLILQLRVKTGFTISENLDENIYYRMDKLRTDNVVRVNKLVEELEQSEIQTIKLFNDRIKDIGDTDLDDKYISLVALKSYATTTENITALAKINKELENIFNEYKSEYTNTMSKDAFEKLNKVSDTIPNILSQITGLSIFLSRILKANFQAWSTEINNDDLSDLIDTSEENLTSYISMSNADGIQPYKSVFNKNKKPLEEINTFVISMAESAGIKSSDLNTENQFKYINLMNYNPNNNEKQKKGASETKDEEDEDDDEEPSTESITLSIIEPLEIMIQEIKTSILQKQAKKSVQQKIDMFVKALKDGNIYDESFNAPIELITARSKSSAKSDNWLVKTEEELGNAMGFILNGILNIVEQQEAPEEAKGVEETKGDDETTGAGKYYYPKRFL
jgi:hypothetical protein